MPAELHDHKSGTTPINKPPASKEKSANFSYNGKVGVWGCLTVLFVVIGLVVMCALVNANQLVKIIDAIQN